MYLARVEEGRTVAVYPVDARTVKMPKSGREKPRAKIEKRRPRAWKFSAERTALCEKLSKPGTAAIGRDAPSAIAAAMRLYSQYQEAMAKRLRAAEISRAHLEVLTDVIEANKRAEQKGGK
jgi:hypothetical protein